MGTYNPVGQVAYVWSSRIPGGNWAEDDIDDHRGLGWMRTPLPCMDRLPEGLPPQ